MILAKDQSNTNLFNEKSSVTNTFRRDQRAFSVHGGQNAFQAYQTYRLQN